MAKHRIGIVGTGGIAGAHVRGYRAVASDLCELVAGCDPDRERLDEFCERHSLEHRFASAEELIASGEADVIALLTPPAVRADVILPALERGVHVLCEKPFAENMADAVSFVEAAERANVTLAVNQSLRFMPDVLAAREIIRAGEIGEVRFIAHDHFQNRTRTTGWRKNETRLEISIFSIHVLDRIRWLSGRGPEAVAAATRRWDASVRGETFTALTIQFEGGAVGTMVSNWHSAAIPECRLRVDGTAGSLLSVKRALAADDATLTVHRAAGRSGSARAAPTGAGAESEQREFSVEHAAVMNMGRSMKEMLVAIDEGREPHHSARDNLDTMAIVDAAYLSASRGSERVEIAEVWRGRVPGV